jgi:hypothetical protein
MKEKGLFSSFWHIVANTLRPFMPLCLVLLFTSIHLHAQSPADKEIFKNADKLIDAKNYREALNSMDGVSSAGRNESRYMFLNAYCYEKLNEPEKALENYRLFYSKTKSVTTQAKIEELEQQLERRVQNENARETCSRCKGSGYYADFKGCDACNNSGKRYSTCNRCNGDEIAPCSACDGTGMAVGLSLINAFSQGFNNPNSTTQAQPIPCTSCNGSKEQKCFSCYSGRMAENCYSCGGAGKLPVKSECVTHQ